MTKLVYSLTFKKAFKKFTKGNNHLKIQIFKTIELLEKDPFSSVLKSHKLSGQLLGLMACSCGYDCRIVFSIEKEKTSKYDIVLLIDIGTHNDVY